MDRVVLGERELESDIENGGTTSGEDTTNDPGSATRQTNSRMNRFWGRLLGLDESVNSSNYSELSDENMALLIEKNSEGEESQQLVARKDAEEKRKKKNSRKPPKPPRPPKGPSLDAADQKLVQEITELAMRKRARMERIKALRKMRASKTSSWNGSLSAMVITVLFCLIIVFQGICSRHNSSILLEGSPEPAASSNDDLISVQFYKNFSAYEDEPGPGSGSGYPSLEEGGIPGSGLRKM